MAKVTKKNHVVPKKGMGKVEDASNVLKQSRQEQDGEGSAGEDPAPAPNAPGAGDEPKPAEPIPGSDNDSAQESQPGESVTSNAPGSTDGDTNSAGEDPAPAPITFPLPTAKQIQDSAEMLANNPGLLESFRNTLNIADQIIAERNKPAKLSAEEMKAANYTKLIATYGKDFVTAKKGNNKGYYSRHSWNQMGNNHRGWVEVTETMPEVQAAKA